MSQREEKRMAMGRIVRRWQNSGLSCAQFARQEGIGAWRLRYWASMESKPSAVVPSFVPVRILPEDSLSVGPRFELIFGDGRRLMIPAELTGPALRDLLVTLGSC